MKTMKTIFALVIAGLIGNSAMASGNLRVNMTSGSKDLAEVEIMNVKMSTFEIEVKDEYGDVIFYKETKAPATNYKRNYDFSRLEDGTYFFTVKIDNEITETKFNIERSQVNVVEEKKMVDPVFVMDNKQLKLSYLNFAQENTKLIVYDRLRNSLYEKDLKSDFVTQHGLDFSKAPRGDYEVVLSSGNSVHSYDVFID
ncbi:MAG TPA: hypothetical protein VK872_08225 [Draconibacterium sp.]|jgi:hypothetical protein|nr:hypothetical protein [Draconibacterium sp.]